MTQSVKKMIDDSHRASLTKETQSQIKGANTS